MHRAVFAVVALVAAAAIGSLAVGTQAGSDARPSKYIVLYSPGATPAMKAAVEDTPAERAEQATIIEAAQRALDYAHQRGVTLIAAAGNGAHDLIIPPLDTQSPNFPPGNDHDRTVNNTCLDLPTEGNNVISVSSVGPSKRKADYSNWGYGEIAVAAPGGWFRDDFRRALRRPGSPRT